MLHPSSVTLCIVAKRCVLEQKLLLTAYRKSYMRNRLVPKWMTLPLFGGRIKVTSTIALYSTLNISETIRDRGLVQKDRQQEMTYGLSNGHVTDDVTWPPKVLWGSTVGYPSDSLASCVTYHTLACTRLLELSEAFSVAQLLVHCLTERFHRLTQWGDC